MDREEKCHISAVERDTGVPQASRESAGRQQWAEHRLEAVPERKVGQTGVTDLGPEVEQKRNIGSRRPYIRPQSAGRWISRSRGVKPSRSIRYQSEQ